MITEEEKLFTINPQEKPCGECHLNQGEVCDICGAKSNITVEYRIALMYSSNQGHYNCIANDDNDIRRISGYSNFVRWLDPDWHKVYLD